MALTKPTQTIISEASLPAGSTTSLADCDPVDLTESAMQAMTVKVDYHGSAASAVTAHVRSSPEGTASSDFDTVDIGSNQQGYWDIPLSAGSTVQSTVFEHPDAKYVKVLVENKDSTYATGSLVVKAVTQEVAPT